MTVKELIAELSKYPENMEVVYQPSPQPINEVYCHDDYGIIQLYLSKD